jgi:hypothetical protein
MESVRPRSNLINSLTVTGHKLQCCKIVCVCSSLGSAMHYCDIACVLSVLLTPSVALT